MPALTAEDRKAFRDYVARTLFVTAWADWMDRYGPGAPGNGCELMTVAPETPEYVYSFADDLIGKLEYNIAPLEEIFERARKTWTHKRPDSAFIDELAYSLTMSSLGHGVGWEDYNERFLGCRGLAHFEFSYFDLDEKDYPLLDAEEEP